MVLALNVVKLRCRTLRMSSITHQFADGARRQSCLSISGSGPRGRRRRRRYGISIHGRRSPRATSFRAIFRHRGRWRRRRTHRSTEISMRRAVHARAVPVYTTRDLGHWPEYSASSQHPISKSPWQRRDTAVKLL